MLSECFMADNLTVGSSKHRKLPKEPQFARDARKLEEWFWNWCVTDTEFFAWLSLEELKGFTGIPKLRLPDVLRRSGWRRRRDGASGVELWTRYGRDPDIDDERSV